MSAHNNFEAEHLNPPFKVEIAPQQTEINQVSNSCNRRCCIVVTALRFPF